MQINFFEKYYDDLLLEDLFEAYFAARKNKRNTINALAFERNFEEQIFSLFEHIKSCTYKPKPSITFIVNKPVKREIFAADFRDRVVHHLIYNYTAPVLEKLFINDSYSCRKGKGTHYGISRIDHFIRSCSKNYKEDCYILKLDIRGYFMSINRKKLYDKVKTCLQLKRHKIDFDFEMVLYLIYETIFNDPTKNCIIKGKKSNWEGLPKDKSLFSAKRNCGLPIGNLTSQLFGNLYLNELDHFVKRDLRIRYYGRYVDDFVLIHRDKEYLKSLIRLIRDYLQNSLNLTLHPDKIYLQHFSKGVKYLGAVIKPHRIYIANRTKGNFYDAIKAQNDVVKIQKPTQDEIEQFISSMNSYLGIMQHYKTYKIRRDMIDSNLIGWWWNHAYMSGGYKKFVKMKRVVREIY